MVDIAMWGKAVRVIPRVSKEEWQRLDVISRWLISTRAAVFVMTLFSAMVGGVLAFRDGMFDGVRFLVCALGLVFAHASNNLMNDLTDSLTGVDKDNYFRTRYGPQPIEHGLVSRNRQIASVALNFTLAALCGLYLIWQVGTPVLWLALAGGFFVLFYTWPLKHIGMGEPAVLIVWGPMMVGGTYLAISGQWSWEVALIGSVYALGPTTVLFGKHTDKLDADKAKGIRTLPVILGETGSRWAVIAMLAAQPIGIVAMVLTGVVGWPMLIALLGVPKQVSAIRQFMKPRPKEPPPGDVTWPLYLVHIAFRTNRITGALFFLGLLADAVVTRFF